VSESFTEWWQHIPYNIDPYIVEIGPVQLTYYGLMYVVAFAVMYLLSLYRIKRKEADYSAKDIENYIIWGALGMGGEARLRALLSARLLRPPSA
jgi:phosphatidylglycerol:prolipoprotein diacylglycerol transferase